MHIEKGEWSNDLPYGTIHRIASSSKCSGVLAKCVDFCMSKISNLRLDTQSDNYPMKRAVQRLGFTRCDIIYCSDGSPREAYQNTIGENNANFFCRRNYLRIKMMK